MDEHKQPYICFDCAKVGKCTQAIRHTHDPATCKNFELYRGPQRVQITLKKLAEMLNMPVYALYARIRYHGWAYVIDMFREKGIMVYREKLEKANRYIYYIKEK